MNILLWIVIIMCIALALWVYQLRLTVATKNKTDKLLIESEQRFQSLLESIPNISVQGYDRHRRVVFWNKASEQLYGYSKDDAIDQRIEDLIIPHEMKMRVIDAINNWMAGGDAIPATELLLRTKSGQSVGVYSSHVMQLNRHGDPEMYCIDIDVTERKKLEEELLLTEAVFQHTSEGMLTINLDRKIIAINPAFTEITGYDESDILGESPSTLMSNRHDAEFYTDINNELNLTGKWQGEVWHNRKTGEEFLVWLTVNTLYNEDGSVKLRVGLFSDITEKKQIEIMALKQANYDALTALPNRNMFNDRLVQEIKKSNRSNKPLAILFLDLDKFKDVNDTFGHPVGDRLLIDAAQRIVECVRDTDTVARLGGDEFVVILSELDELYGIERIANKIILSLSQPFQLDNIIAYVSASIGITLYPEDANNVDDLLKNADQAMYFAKDSGRSRFSYFTQQMQISSLERFNLTKDLREALSKNQLEVYYQPIIDSATGKAHKAEALLRWHHPERGTVSPTEFIPIAEEAGLINEIGRWVFQQAVKQVEDCLHYDENFQISINVSPVQFREKNDWESIISQPGFIGRHVVIEITEGLLMEDNELVAEQLLSFRDAGIQVAIDDFGTGYSSLSYLNKFDIDYLKIDQSFIRNLSLDSSEMALSEAMIVMAHKLGLKVIAEGVETHQQYELLATAGCDYIQGYLFSKPLPAKQFEAFLKASADREVGQTD